MSRLLGNKAVAAFRRTAPARIVMMVALTAPLLVAGCDDGEEENGDGDPRVQ